MNRAEHLQWRKERALEYVKEDELENAFASFQSDMTKHDETNGHMALEMGTMLLVSGNLSTRRQMTDWINGFN